MLICSAHWPEANSPDCIKFFFFSHGDPGDNIKYYYFYLFYYSVVFSSIIKADLGQTVGSRVQIEVGLNFQTLLEARIYGRNNDEYRHQTGRMLAQCLFRGWRRQIVQKVRDGFRHFLVSLFKTFQKNR